MHRQHKLFPFCTFQSSLWHHSVQEEAELCKLWLARSGHEQVCLGRLWQQVLQVQLVCGQYSVRVFSCAMIGSWHRWATTLGAWRAATTPPTATATCRGAGTSSMIRFFNNKNYIMINILKTWLFRMSLQWIQAMWWRRRPIFSSIQPSRDRPASPL